jgi:hypothetical protein
MAGSGDEVKPDIGRGFGNGDRFWKLGLIFSRKNISGVNIFTNRANFPNGKNPGGNPTGDGVPCGVMQGCHCRDRSQLGLAIAPETMAIARLGFKHSRVGSSELARSNFNRE